MMNGFGKTWTSVFISDPLSDRLTAALAERESNKGWLVQEETNDSVDENPGGSTHMDVS